MHFTFEPIALVESCFVEKFGVPRQSGLAPSTTATLRMLPPYNVEAAFEGLEQCSHIWLQFVFHQNKHQQWQPKVRPPRLGGNDTVGVFATRSPYRPNALGLSVVKLERIIRSEQGVVLEVSGIDFVDGTPILDIKPYLPYVDCLTAATNDLASAPPDRVDVGWSAASESFCNTYFLKTGTDLKQILSEVLSQDPRPQYHNADVLREYGCRLFDLNVRFSFQNINGKGYILVLDIC